MTILKEIVAHTSRVAIVDPNMSLALPMRSVLLDLGYHSVSMHKSWEQVINWEDPKKRPTWVIGLLSKDQPMNALAFLEEFYLNETNDQCNVSLFLTDEEQTCVPTAFELGLLSHHSMGTQDVNHLQNEIKTLIANLIEYHCHGTEVAFQYLRSYLVKNKHWEDLVKLQENMLNQFPDNQDLILYLAEAYFFNDQKNLGKKILEEANFFDAKHTKKMEFLFKEFLGAKVETEKLSFAKKHGVSNAILIDNDENNLNLMKEIITAIGFTDIELFTDSQKAWNHLKSIKEPDLIISEWSLDNITGKTLLQRIRSHGFRVVPILVATSQIQKSDRMVLTDLNILQVFKKPLDKKQLTMSIAFHIRQYFEPTEARTIERKIIRFLSHGDHMEVKSLFKKYINMETIPTHRIEFIKGLSLTIDQEYDLASECLIKSIQSSKHSSVDAMSLLSDVMLKKSDYQSSIAMMEKVIKISSETIEHYCKLADIHLQNEDPTSAYECLQKAVELDSDNDIVVESLIKHSIYVGDTEQAQQLLQNFAFIDKVIGFMNNIAVVMSQKGRFKTGVKMYEKTLDALSVKFKKHRAIVYYNLSLAWLRQGLMTTSRTHLESCIQEGQSRVFSKAEKLLERLVDAEKRGKTIKLNSNNNEKRKMKFIESNESNRIALLNDSTDHDVHNLLNLFRETKRSKLANDLLEVDSNDEGHAS